MVVRDKGISLGFFSKLPVDFTGADLRIMRKYGAGFPDSVSLHNSQSSGKMLINSGTRLLLRPKGIITPSSLTFHKPGQRVFSSYSCTGA